MPTYYYGGYYDSAVSPAGALGIPLGLGIYEAEGDPIAGFREVGTSHTTDIDTYLNRTWAVKLGADTYYTTRTSFYDANSSKYLYAFDFINAEVVASKTFLSDDVTFSLPPDAISVFSGGASGHRFRWYINGGPAINGYGTLTITPSNGEVRFVVYADDFRGQYGTSAITTICTASTASVLTCCSTASANISCSDCGESGVQMGSAIEGKSCTAYLGTTCPVLGSTCHVLQATCTSLQGNSGCTVFEGSACQSTGSTCTTLRGATCVTQLAIGC